MPEQQRGRAAEDYWVFRLAPTGPLHAPATSEATVAQATAELGAGPVACAVGLSHALATLIIEVVPEFGEGVDAFDTLRMGTEAVVLRALALLAGVPVATDAPEEALLGNREFARRRIALEKVLRGIRVSHGALAEALMAACQDLAPPEDHAREIRRVSEVLHGYVDEFATRMTADYIAEHDRWVTSGAAAREETVRQILAGETPRDQAAESALGYPLRGRHVALVVWTEDAEAASGTTLQQAAARFLRRHRCQASLLVPTGRTTLWAWGLAPVVDDGTGPEGSEEHPGSVWERESGGVRIACGSEHAGIAGFRRSHQEAQDAARLMRLNPGTAPVVCYQQVALACLLSADLPTARRFVEDELAGLAADTVQAEQLRETLRQYLRSERSLAASGAQLHVARNTVTYRVKRAQELIGHDVSTRLAEVLAALETAHALGSAVLTDTHDDLHGSGSRRT